MPRITMLVISMICISVGCSEEPPKNVTKRPSGQTAVSKFQIVRADELKLPEDDDEIDRTIHASVAAVIASDMLSDENMTALIMELESLHKDLPRTPDNQLSPQAKALLDDRINELKERIEITREPNGEVEIVTVAITHDDPSLAAKVANQLVDNHFKFVRTTMDEALIQHKARLLKEKTHWRRRLSELEIQKLRFMVASDGIDPENPSVIIEKLAEEKVKLNKAIEKHDGINAAINQLNQTIEKEGKSEDSTKQLAALTRDTKKAEEIVVDANDVVRRYELFYRRYIEVRAEYKKIEANTKDAEEQLNNSDAQLRRSQDELTLPLSVRAVKMKKLLQPGEMPNPVEFIHERLRESEKHEQ